MSSRPFQFRSFFPIDRHGRRSFMWFLQRELLPRKFFILQFIPQCQFLITAGFDLTGASFSDSSHLFRTILYKFFPGRCFILQFTLLCLIHDKNKNYIGVLVLACHFCPLVSRGSSTIPVAGPEVHKQENKTNLSTLLWQTYKNYN